MWKENHNKENIPDNRKFWKTIFNAFKSNNKQWRKFLAENEKMFPNDVDVAKVLNKCSSKVIELVGISQNKSKSFTEEIANLFIKLYHYKHLPSTLAMSEKYISKNT